MVDDKLKLSPDAVFWAEPSTLDWLVLAFAWLTASAARRPLHT